MKKRLLKLFACVLALSLLLTACGGGGGAPAAEGSTAGSTPATGGSTAGLKELKFGVSAPYTGPYAQTGLETKDVVTMRLEEINYQIGNYKLVPVWIDDQGDPEAGVRAYEQAVVKDGIQASLFCNWSSVAVGEMEVSAKYKIPHFVSWGAASIVSQKWLSDKKYEGWLKAYPEPQKMSVTYVNAIDDMVRSGQWKPASQKFYVYGEDTDWARSVGTGMATKFKEIGWEKVGEDYFKSGETDFYSLLTKMKASGASLLVGSIDAASSSSSFVKQAREVNMPALIICETVSQIGDFYDLAGTAANGILDCRQSYLNNPSAGEDFNKKFEKKYGYPTSAGNGGFNYDCFNYFLKVVEETDKLYGNVNAETLLKFSVDEIQSGKFTWNEGMVMPEIRYDADSLPDPVVGSDAYYNPVLQMQNGKWEVVSPAEYATSKFYIPDYAK